MDKLLIRFVTVSECELYRLERGVLRFVQSGTLSDLYSKRIGICILSPENYVCSETLSASLDFKPSQSTFLFGDVSLFEPSQVLFLPAEELSGDRGWRQVWILRSKIDLLSEKMPTVVRFLPELNFVSPNAESSNVSDVEVDSDEVSPRFLQTTEDVLTVNTSAVLDNFILNEVLPGFFAKRPRPTRKFVVILAFVFSLCVPWLYLPFYYSLHGYGQDSLDATAVDVPIRYGSYLPSLAGAHVTQLEINLSRRFVAVSFRAAPAVLETIIDETVEMCGSGRCTFEIQDDDNEHYLVIFEAPVR